MTGSADSPYIDPGPQNWFNLNHSQFLAVLCRLLILVFVSMSRPSPMRSDDSASSQQIPRPPQAGDETRPVALCKFDEHMMSLVPSYEPMNKEQLRHFLFLSGATEDTMDQCLQAYNRRMEHKIQRGGFRVIGVRFRSSSSSPSYLNLLIKCVLG